MLRFQLLILNDRVITSNSIERRLREDVFLFCFPTIQYNTDKGVFHSRTNTPEAKFLTVFRFRISIAYEDVIWDKSCLTNGCLFCTNVFRVYLISGGKQGPQKISCL